MSVMVDKRILYEVALTEEEYDLVVEKLGREPSIVELGMFGALWSEHCGYKNSKPVLRLFPTQGTRVLQGPGENAGVVDIGDGLGIVLKIESHNHPSAIEPYQGAATGVGGIIRDIFTMGARPIALLNSLRFGPLSKARNRYLFSGVVAGIGGYGNCIGIPTVAGEVYFDESYSGNPLVNAMCVGVIESAKLIRATASGEGNLLMLVGADTGRDGIHGATFASVELDERSEERRPAVQVGNPFLEKLLMEACLELLDTGYLVGMQDLGAAGLTSSTVECASKGDSGVDIDLAHVPRRESGMTPYELMLSESQERMLVIVKRGYEDKVREIFERWDLHSEVIGQVTSDGIVRVREHDEVVAEIPAKLLTDEVPIYHRTGVRPTFLTELNTLDLESVPVADPNEALLKLLAWPNIASKEYVYRQYDYTIRTNTVILPGDGDAAVTRIKGTSKAIALTTDCNGRYCYLDPYRGGALAVAEAARNLVCVGAKPLAVTNCLNFGNPEKPEIYYQLENCVKGMAEACRILDTPVVSGNVSLYNESSGEAIYPTPVVGMLGLLDNADKRCGMGFQGVGDVIALLGGLNQPTLGGSDYLEAIHGRVGGMPPSIDLDFERRAQDCCLEAIRSGLIKSAHDCGEGGLAVALAESCIVGQVGANITLKADEGRVWEKRIDTLLFGEAPSRIVISLGPDNLSSLERLAREYRVPLLELGRTGGEGLHIDSLVKLPLAHLVATWRGSLEAISAAAPTAVEGD